MINKFAIVCCFLAIGWNQTATMAQDAVHPDPDIPNENGLLLVSPIPGTGKNLALMKTPQGGVTGVPITEVRIAIDAGYKPFTAGDLIASLNEYAAAIKEQQKKLGDISSDYNRLAERYNRLAAVNSGPAVVAQAPPVDVAATMRLMMFQSLLSKNPNPQPVQVQVTNCNAQPALCVR